MTAEHEPDPDARALNEALRTVIDARDEPITDRPLVSLLFAAVVGAPYEGAEGDTPGVAVLRAVRATVEGWAEQRNGSTLFAAVPFADLHILKRWLDAAIEIVRRSPGGAP
jgi:hypothetical protein